ncbi:MAG: TIGR00266 family protein [Fimbriimonadaceae bacterium]|nr:TIGR00266 family protein [Fimbriimonadaceae bacterium]
MRYEIRGTVLQMVDIHLEAGEAVFTESGGMAWMKGPIDMKTGTRGGALKAIGRMLGGESLFLTTYTAQGAAMVTFVPEAIGKVLAIPLQAGQSLICAKDSFMCAEDGVQLEVHFRGKVGAGLFGGMGFVLQKISGPGTAFLEISGEVTEYALGAGETMKVDPGHIAFFEPSVSHSVETVKGLANIFGGGEGLFLATLTGPGKIWLRSMPLPNLAQAISRYSPSKG